jgi:hypothetical protein
MNTQTKILSGQSDNTTAWVEALAYVSSVRTHKRSMEYCEEACRYFIDGFVSNALFCDSMVQYEVRVMLNDLDTVIHMEQYHLRQ